MTLDEFRRLAETWGGDIGRWPEARKIEAAPWVLTEDGEAILQQARRLDALLAAASPVVTPERVSRAALAVVQKIAAEGIGGSRPSPWNPREWLMPAASLVCSAAIGVFLAMVAPYGASDGQTMILSAILDTGSMTWVIQ
jgi:hypothetical protein